VIGRLAVVLVMALVAACTTTSTGGSSGSPSTQPDGSPTTTRQGEDSGIASVPSGEPGMGCWATEAYGGSGGTLFEDVTEAVGLIDPLTGMHPHTAIWTDTNGDDWPDLYVGTFADREAEAYQERGAEGPAPDRLLLGGDGTFTVDDTLPEAFSRSSGGVGADLDNDGDLDLAVARNTDEPEPGQDPTQILENVDGVFQVVADSGIPADLGGRSVGVLDYDQDGVLDLFIAEDRFAGETSVLFRNEGGLRFADANAEAGIPEGVHGLGVAIADFDSDGLSDIFVSGSNRLFLSDGPGQFVEGDSSVFEWELFGDEDDVAGASVADVNRDGLLDLALGQHFNSTLEFGETVSVRLYLNEGDGAFRDVTEEAGLDPIPTKAPHVELNDFNNDGWPDLLTSASSGEGPALFMTQGLEGDVPMFTTPEGMGDAQYWVAAPTADYDRDGRLDIFLLEWEPSLPSILLRNVTETGNWLQVSVEGESGFGIGWLVEVFDGDTILGAREITVTQGYSAGVMPMAHFGLGEAAEVDVRITPPGGADPVLVEGVAANQHIRWPDGC
jgi:hypothetical protein